MYLQAVLEHLPIETPPAAPHPSSPQWKAAAGMTVPLQGYTSALEVEVNHCEHK